MVTAAIVSPKLHGKMRMMMIKTPICPQSILIPTHQPVSEIVFTRHRISSINSLLDAYKAKKKNIQQYCRVFDTKELVTKHDVDSRVLSKLPPKDVRSLAMDALKLATTKLADIEEVKGN